MKLDSGHAALLKRYARPIVHMKAQLNAKRFGLMLGAGLSKPFDTPNWAELVDALAADPLIGGEDILAKAAPRNGLPYRTEMLYEHYRRARFLAEPAEKRGTRELECKVAAEWLEILRRHLYAKEPADFAAALSAHPYLERLLPLVKLSPLTVTYNFDDYLEQALALHREPDKGRGYETVTNPWVQFRQATAVVYHPNGIIPSPRSRAESPSDRVVFSEASYAESLMGFIGDDTSALRHHLSKSTCLFIGLSLEDETIRAVLSQSARTVPGNYHYFVSFDPAPEKISEERIRAISATNFKVYNLVTLFLNAEDISALAELLHADENVFCEFAEEHGVPVKYVYYLTGPLGVGKSTTANHFRNLQVADEWVDRRPDLLCKAWTDLTPDERGFADDWVLGQFKLKNDWLRARRFGLFVVDRPPLDPLAFVDEAGLAKKADEIVRGLCPGVAKWSVEDGRIIRLEGDPKELAMRMLMTSRSDYTSEKLERMSDTLGKVYAPHQVVIDTRGLHVDAMVRRVAEVIHNAEFVPYGLHERLVAISKAGVL